jgi:hypothetical protein
MDVSTLAINLVKTVNEQASLMRVLAGFPTIGRIDPFSLARTLGYRIEFGAPQGISAKRWHGVLLPAPYKILILHPDDSEENHRFTIGEEIAHDCFEHHLTTVTPSGLHGYDRRQEKIARHHARALLLPQVDMAYFDRLKRPYADIAHEYGVKEKVVVSRMEFLGLKMKRGDEFDRFA